VGWHLFCFGVYEDSVRRLFQRYVPTGGVVVDVGANVGWHTVLLSKLVGARGSVHAFEPNPAVYEELLQNLRRNRCTNVTAHKMAISDRRGTMRFIAPDVGEADAGDGHLTTTFDCQDYARSIEVDVMLLDDFLLDMQRVDLLKIDVEGFEPAVIVGAEKSVRKHHPVVIFENLPSHLARAGLVGDAMETIFRSEGYVLYSFSDREVPTKLVNLKDCSGDFLALPEMFK